MTRPNAIFFDRSATRNQAVIATEDETFSTLSLVEDRYVKINDGKQYPQVCVGAKRTGNTLIYHNDETLARDCNARIFKTRAGFDRAVALMQEV